MKKAALIFPAAVLLLAFAVCAFGQKRGDTGSREPPAITVKIRNDTGADIADIGISWSRNGKMLGSRGMEHADHTPYEEGKVCAFEFFPKELASGEGTELRFDVFAEASPGEDYAACGTVRIAEFAFGDVYSFELRMEDGRCSLWQVLENGVCARMPQGRAADEDDPAPRRSI